MALDDLDFIGGKAAVAAAQQKRMVVPNGAPSLATETLNTTNGKTLASLNSPNPNHAGTAP